MTPRLWVIHSYSLPGGALGQERRHRLRMLEQAELTRTLATTQLMAYLICSINVRLSLQQNIYHFSVATFGSHNQRRPTSLQYPNNICCHNLSEQVSLTPFKTWRSNTEMHRITIHETTNCTVRYGLTLFWFEMNVTKEERTQYATFRRFCIPFTPIQRQTIAEKRVACTLKELRF